LPSVEVHDATSQGLAMGPKKAALISNAPAEQSAKVSAAFFSREDPASSPKYQAVLLLA